MEQMRAGIVKAALVMVGEVFAAELNHFRVQINHRRAFHRAVGQYFPECAAFAAAADENLLWFRVAEHRRMHQRFVVDMLVPFGRLGFAVEYQTTAK